jgi:hypothetical protein
MTDERKKALFAKIDGTEELCNYCPLPEERRGMCSPKSVGCEGSCCKNARENYLEETEEKV